MHGRASVVLFCTRALARICGHFNNLMSNVQLFIFRLLLDFFIIIHLSIIFFAITIPIPVAFSFFTILIVLLHLQSFGMCRLSGTPSPLAARF